MNSVYVTESQLREIIKEAIVESFENRTEGAPEPKYKVGETVAVNYAADRMFGPDGIPAVIGAREWNPNLNMWVYFCIHKSMDRRGWFKEEELQPYTQPEW